MTTRDWCLSVLTLMVIMDAFGQQCVGRLYAGQLIRVGKSGVWKRPARRPPFSRTYDIDTDGRLSAAEWRRVEDMLSGLSAAEIFSLLDRNDDGWLNKSEFNNWKQRLGIKNGKTAWPLVHKRLIGA
ncbi:PREDICTED: uncharacterized protein LOC109464053 [Branchiostoma belcheri]|uniref:Uncharacterized protein LOC109464053 n=1 Tax=Branchiostoma belcheri TaxID=7741 RepID=A0A6P4XJ16_BRABE|nr:PREDICTED: uncharacterized protein LOC109464053 [Branchiostoma belcheri]